MKRLLILALLVGCGGTGAVVTVPAGGAIARSAGSALRLELRYQGSTVSVTSARAVDMVLPPADARLEAGKNSGYWAELRGADGAVLFTRILHDPTSVEAPPAPGGSFTNTAVDASASRTISLDVPNDARASVLVIYGNPSGTQGPASEIARFTLK